MSSKRIVLFMLACVFGLGAILTPTPVNAAAIMLCSGTAYSTCTNANYTDHGYGQVNGTPYWNMFPGHNCTNYAAYMAQKNGASQPSHQLGHAYQWNENAVASGVKVDDTPMPGSIAQWEIDSQKDHGHVAYVEKVTNDYIIISEDNYAPISKFQWKKINKNDSEWPDSFIHFADNNSFSGDQLADILWYESWNNGQGKLLKTNHTTGTGLSSAHAWFSGYAAPTWADTGDFNNDGRSDIAWFESWNNGTLKVMLSNGNGFDSHTWFTGYGAPTRAFVGDFTGDGNDDIGWYESWNNGGTLKVIRASDDGKSTNGSYNWLVGYANPDWADAGDLNGDGKDDIAWFEGWNNGTMKVIHSSGSGTHSTVNWFSGYAAPTWAKIGNFAGGLDKKEDIAWYESWSNGTLKVIPSNGTSAGTPITWFSGYAAPTRAFAADFTGDRREDIGWYEASNNGTMKVVGTNSTGTGAGSSYTWFSGYGAPTWAVAR